MAKKFKVTIKVDPAEFNLPVNATDEEYDTVRDLLVAGIREDVATGKAGKVKVELIEAPDEIKEKYIINKDCQD